ncbi:putative dna repair protein rad9 protein [Eutypa lata UCREL1]|uniref:DNA repair protein rad9 n=1 Tax=Eutypa lata (strain UCR-EL1) TaxID=1287681 RepID=M7T2L6_EUTLA|nr:putative dna repair protein rad9 protein [Eutypa lata UCREL1]
MPVLRFTLSEEGVSVLRDALACLGKFSDEVTLNAKRNQFTISTINLTKTAHVNFSFTTTRFFSAYQYEGTGPYRITTKYKLPYEAVPPVRAKFDSEQAINHWSISSRTLRQLMDHFGPGIEYLDIHSDDDQFVNLTCFTEKVVRGDEVLKKPLHTSIAVERDEFESFEAEEENIHIVISVKDFRAIIHHAGILGSEITATYSVPSQPMQLKYDGAEIKCEFLLMTVGERGAPGQKAKRPRANAKAPRHQLEASASRATSRAPESAPQPVQQPAAQANPMLSLRPSITRPSQRPPPATLQDESLFVTQDNDDQWEPVNPGEDEDEEENARLEWDASGIQRQSTMNMRSMIANQDEPTNPDAAAELPSQFEPTQRLSDVRKFGLFGE